MASDVEALRTLGLAPGASQAEIKRAYRRLAKAFHPDTAGEAAIPRFLAIQAAYETLTGTSLGPARWSSRPADVWQADPDRARATRDNWRGRGFGRTAEPRSRAGSGGNAESGEPRRPPGTGSAAGRRAGGRPRSRRDRTPDKATPGSTTYDVADDEPFDPEWSGASWYGTSSGTYWTINPREYADPRKHGPEYQARGRRAPSTAADAADASAAGPAEAAPDEPLPRERPHYQAPPPPPRVIDDEERPAPPPFSSRLPLAGRVPLALIGWPPIGILLVAIIGEASGCSRFAAGCSQDTSVVIWVAQLAVVTVLLTVPRLAAISSIGTLVALATAVPATLLLSVGGGAQERAASIAALSAVLTIAYLGGVAYGVVGGSRRLRP